MTYKRTNHYNLKSYILLAVLFTLSFSSFATRLQGVVRDDEGNILPFAAITIKDSNRGTSANAEGQYFLELPEGNTTLQVRVIGYRTITRSINVTGTEMNLDFKLEFEGNELAEFVVKANAEDPAYAIMRKVIASKNKNAKKLKSLETDIYLKGKLYIKSIPNKLMGMTLSDSDRAGIQKDLNLDTNNTGIVYLLEQFTKYYYKAPNKSFHRVNAVKTSGDPRGLGFATMPAIVDVYENNVNMLSGVNPRGFISPAHSNAFQYYKYKLLSSYEEDGMLINKISFWPRRSKEPTFRGTLYIVENDWAFQQLELILDKNAQIEIVDTLILKQQYRKAVDKNWVIQQQVLYPVINIFGFEIAGDFLTNYTNAKINESIPDSIFNSRILTVYDSAALRQETDHWRANRPVGLSVEEEDNYVFQDSVFKRNTERNDSLYNATIIKFKPIDILVGGAYYKKKNDQAGLLPLISSLGYNTVEGLTIGLDPYWKHGLGKGDSLNIIWRNHYGMANRQLQSMLEWDYLNVDSAFIGRQFSFWGKMGRKVSQINDHDPIQPIINTFGSLFYGLNYMKIYQANKLQLGIKQNFGNGFSLYGDVDFEDRTAMQNNTDFSFMRRSRVRFTDNQPEQLPPFEDHRAAIISLGVRYQPGWKFIQYPEYRSGVGSTAPVFELNYKKGIPNIFNSRSDFDKWQLSMEHSFNMKLQGLFKYRLVAGGFLSSNYVGNPDLYHLHGNRTSIANPYLRSFQTAPYFDYSNTPSIYSQVHVAWHLNGFLTNKIPGFKKLNWHLVLSGNGMYINEASYYGEYGIGLENIGFKMFKLFRIDLVGGRGSQHPDWQLGYRIGANIPLGT